MFYIYDDSSPKGKFDNDVKFSPTKMYLKHFDNKMFLSFIAKNPIASFLERQQAEKELAICDRKLTYWERKYGYDHKKVIEGIVEIKKKWNSK